MGDVRQDLGSCSCQPCVNITLAFFRETCDTAGTKASFHMRNERCLIHFIVILELKEMRPVLSASAFLKANKVRHKKESASSSKSRTQFTTEVASSKDSPKPSTPVLGRGLNFDDDVFFDENVPLNMSRKSANNCDKAKVI